MFVTRSEGGVELPEVRRGSFSGRELYALSHLSTEFFLENHSYFIHVPAIKSDVMIFFK
jgi:hypothetical protein